MYLLKVCRVRAGIKAAASNFHSLFETLKKLKAKKGYRENKVEVGRIGKNGA